MHLPDYAFPGLCALAAQQARGISIAERIGLAMLAKYRARVAEAGAGTVARQLRKQGIDFRTALLLTIGIEERFAQ